MENKEKQKQHLIDMMQGDEKLGLYKEPKQETLEEAAKRIANDSKHSGIKLDYQDGIYYGVKIGGKWQDDKMYSEKDLIEANLVEEEPEIPQLGEGVLMEVSSVGRLWSQEKVIAMTKDGKYLDADFVRWKYARPIQQLTKYTHAELVEKLGHNFEIIG